MSRVITMEFSSDFVGECARALQAHQETVVLLKSWRRAHDVSELINEDSNTVRGILMGIRDATDAALRLETSENKEEVRMLASWTCDLRSNLGTTSKSLQMDVVTTMEKRLKDTELKAVVEEFNLYTPFNKAYGLVIRMGRYRALRDLDNTNTRDAREGFRKRVMTDLRLLFAVFEAAARYATEENEKKYFTEACIKLEKLLMNASAVAKARATRSMNGKDAEGEHLPEEGVENDTGGYNGVDNAPESDHNPEVGDNDGGDVNEHPAE